jgi:hypothetical protein
MVVSGRRGAVITTLFQDTPHTLMPAAARQPPHRSWIELSATLDFLLATLVGRGAAWSVETLPAIKGQLAPLPTACEGPLLCRFSDLARYVRVESVMRSNPDVHWLLPAVEWPTKLHWRVGCMPVPSALPVLDNLKISPATDQQL